MEKFEVKIFVPNFCISDNEETIHSPSTVGVVRVVVISVTFKHKYENKIRNKFKIRKSRQLLRDSYKNRFLIWILIPPMS